MRKKSDFDIYLFWLVYAQLFIIFLLSLKPMGFGFILICILLSLFAFLSNLFFKEKGRRLRGIFVDVGSVVLFLWLIYSIANSSFSFEEVIYLFLKTLLILEVILSFNLSAPRVTHYIQVVSLIIFLCLPLFIPPIDLYFKFLSLLYLLGWIFTINRKFISFMFSFRKELIKFIVFCFFLISLSLFFASLLSKNTSLVKTTSSTRGFWETKKYDIENELYILQEELYNAFTSLKVKSLEEKSKIIKYLSTLTKNTPYVKEVEKARLGLIDLLKRPGPGIVKKISKEKAILEKFSNVKIENENRTLKNKFKQKVKSLKSSFLAKIKMLIDLNRLKKSDDVSSVNNLYSRLKQNIENLKTPYAFKRDLKDSLRKIKKWKEYSLYNQMRSKLEKEIVSLKDNQDRDTLQNMKEEIERSFSYQDLKDISIEFTHLQKFFQKITGKYSYPFKEKINDFLLLKEIILLDEDAEKILEGIKEIRQEYLEKELVNSLDKVVNAKSALDFYHATEKILDILHKNSTLRRIINRDKIEEIVFIKIDIFLNVYLKNIEELLKKSVVEKEEMLEFTKRLRRIIFLLSKDNLNKEIKAIRKKIKDWEEKGLISSSTEKKLQEFLEDLIFLSKTLEMIKKKHYFSEEQNEEYKEVYSYFEKVWRKLLKDETQIQKFMEIIKQIVEAQNIEEFLVLKDALSELIKEKMKEEAKETFAVLQKELQKLYQMKYQQFMSHNLISLIEELEILYRIDKDEQLVKLIEQLKDIYLGKKQFSPQLLKNLEALKIKKNKTIPKETEIPSGEFLILPSLVVLDKEAVKKVRVFYIYKNTLLKDITQEVSWSFSNPSVAWIDSSGVIHPLSTGETAGYVEYRGDRCQHGLKIIVRSYLEKEKALKRAMR